MENRRDEIGFKIVDITNSIVNFFVVAVVFILIIISLFALWDTDLVVKQADSKQYEIYKPSAYEYDNFEDIVAINEDVIAWLDVYGTHIDYPVVQGKDNSVYVNTNVKGEFAASGSIFLDARNDRNFSDFVSILYGHHMDMETMFGELDRFADEAYFNEHRYGNLFFGNMDHGLEFVAYLHVDVYNRAVFNPKVDGEQAQKAYIDLILENAIYYNGRPLSTSDRIVLLTTCSSGSTNGRDIVVAVMKDETYKNAFTDMEKETFSFGKDFIQKTGWIWFSLLGLLILFLLLFLKKKKKKEDEIIEGDETHEKEN